MVHFSPNLDLFREYLLKQWLQTSKAEPVYRTMYDHAMSGIKRHLVAYSHPSEFTFIGELPSITASSLSPKMDHLVCFIGANFALGATEGKTVAEAKKQGWTVRQQEDLDLGEAITRSCYEMYNATATGIAPEIVRFNTDPLKDEDITIRPNDRWDSSGHSSYANGLDTTFNGLRQWRVYSSFGDLRATLNIVSGDGKYSRPLKNGAKLRMEADTHPSPT